MSKESFGEWLCKHRKYSTELTPEEMVKLLTENPATEEERRMFEWSKVASKFLSQKAFYELRDFCYAVLLGKGSKEEKINEISERLAQRITIYRRIITTRDDKSPEMWIWEEGIFVPNAQTYIDEFAREILAGAYRPSIVYEIVAKVRAMTYMDAHEFFNSTPKDRVCVQNGLLDLETRELLPFSAQEIHFVKLPITYDPEKECPHIQAFFRDITEDEGAARVVEELFGFVLSPDYFLEKSIMLVGNGANGKSKLMKILELFIGSENTSAVTLDQLSNDQYAAAMLHGKLLNLGGDISDKPLSDTSIFKQLTGRNPVHANRKYAQPIVFENYAKMVFAANKLPLTYDTSYGVFRRGEMIEFPFTFVPRDEYAAESEEERVAKRHKEMDPEIVRHIVDDDELSGLLNLALERRSELRERKSFSDSRSVAAMQNAWMRRSNSFFAFCREMLREDSSAVIVKQELARVYSRYCRDNDTKPLSDRGIKRFLMQEFGATEQRPRWVDDRPWVWVGVRFERQSAVMSDLSSNGRYVSYFAEKPAPAFSESLTRRIIALLRSGSGPVPYENIAAEITESEEELLLALAHLCTLGSIIEHPKGYYQLLEVVRE